MKKLFKSSIFHNFSWLFADKLIRLALSLFVSVVVARYLGPAQYGLWNYFLSFTMFFTAFVSLGFENIIPRELINHPEKEEEIISLAFALKIIGGLIGFCLSIFTYYLYKKPDIELLIMMSLMASLLIFQAADIFDIFYKTKLQAKYAVIGRNIAFVIVALLKLYFVWKHFPLIYFVATISIEFLLGGLLVFYMFMKQGHRISLRKLNWNLGFGFLKDGLPMAISGFMIMIYMRIDQVMLTDMAGETANGIYSTGVRLIEIIYFVPMALADSFFPGIVYSKKHEGDKYASNMLSFYSIMIYVAIAISIVTIIVAKPMMNLLFGIEYEGSGAVLQVLGFSLLATFLSVASGKYLITENYLRVIFTRSFLGLGLNIILNLLWIPKYGYMGAAYASLLSYIIPTLTLLFFSSTRHQLKLILLAFNPIHIRNKLKSD